MFVFVYGVDRRVWHYDTLYSNYTEIIPVIYITGYVSICYFFQVKRSGMFPLGFSIRNYTECIYYYSFHIIIDYLDFVRTTGLTSIIASPGLVLGNRTVNLCHWTGHKELDLYQ